MIRVIRDRIHTFREIAYKKGFSANFWVSRRTSTLTLTRCSTQVLFAPLPVLWITGTLASANKGDKNVYYTCPTYKAPRRTGLNYITAVDLRTDDSASKWTLRGVALLTTTE